MLKIGITGGIGSGKSTVCRIFSMLGIPVFDADSVAKELMVTNQILISNICNAFGKDVYHSDGTLNRELLAQKAFLDQKQISKLNSLVHPVVLNAFDSWVNQHTSPYVIKEAALMFESNADKRNDVNIVVLAPEDVRIKRVIQRDGSSEEKVRARMSHQMPEKEKIERADYVIINDESTLLIPQILHLHQVFSNK